MKYKIGDTAEKSLRITEKIIQGFAEVTGDRNPVHLDEDYAKSSVFGKRIAHGMISAGLISSVIGMELPGEGTIYLTQDLQFRKPVFLEDEIKAVITVKEIDENKNRMILETLVVNQNQETVLVGIAKVIPPK